MPTRGDRGDHTLDPRLRRLVDSIDDPARLRDDLHNAVVNAPAEAAPEPVDPATLTTDVLVQLRPHASPPAVAGVRWVQVVDDIYAAEVAITALEPLAASPSVVYVEAGRPLRPELMTSLPETGADRLHPPPPTGSGLTGAGVVVGVVDSGLDFTHDDFRNPDGTTRIAFLWDQRLSAGEAEHAPARYGFGVEYDAKDIDRAITAPDPFTLVRHQPGPASHGAHVTGIAAGNGRAADAQFPAGRFIGAAPEATIIFVQQRVAPGTTLTDSPHVAMAIAYIYEKAAELGLPCVVNVSLGMSGGSHDGESLVERVIDRLLETPGRAFIKSAGNEHTWRGHASGQVAAGERRTLQWQVQGATGEGGGRDAADRTPNALELWYSSRDRLQLALVSPTGERTPAVPPDEQRTHRFGNGNVVSMRSERFSALNGDARIYVEVAPGTTDRVVPGTWQVVVDAVEAVDGRFDAWIERDHAGPTDQSFFLGTDFDESMTISTPATARRAIAVGNYDHRTESLHAASGRGRTRDGRDKPEVAAPGSGIVSSHALGGRPGPHGKPFPMRVAFTGTSMSAPHVAGIVALLLQRRPDLTAVQIRKLLIASANPAEPSSFHIGWGYGRVAAVKAVELAG